MRKETEEEFQEFASRASLDQVIRQRPSAAALLSMCDINEGEVVGASLYTWNNGCCKSRPKTSPAWLDKCSPEWKTETPEQDRPGLIERVLAKVKDWLLRVQRKDRPSYDIRVHAEMTDWLRRLWTKEKPGCRLIERGTATKWPIFP